MKEFDYQNLYLEAKYGGRVYAYVHVQTISGVAYVHLYIQRWSRAILRELRADFDALRAELRAVGVWRILGTHEAQGAAKWCRFVGLLGFTQIIDTVMPEGTPCKLAMMEV